MAWGTQERGAELLHGEVQASGGETGKSPPAAANEEGTRGRHGARPAQRGRQGGRRKNQVGNTLGVWDNSGGREASGVDHKSPKVRDKEGGREASEVTENPRGSHQGVGRGVELPQGNNTPGVTEFPRGMKPPEGPPRERAHRGRTDGGGEETPPPPTTRATGVQGDGGRDDELMGGPRMAAPPHPQQVTAADDDRSETPPKHTTSAPRVRLTGANGDGGRPS